MDSCDYEWVRSWIHNISHTPAVLSNTCPLPIGFFHARFRRFFFFISFCFVFRIVEQCKPHHPHWAYLGWAYIYFLFLWVRYKWVVPFVGSTTCFWYWAIFLSSLAQQGALATVVSVLWFCTKLSSLCVKCPSLV